MKIKSLTFIAATLCSGLNVYSSEIGWSGTELYSKYHKKIMDDNLITEENDKVFSVSKVCEKIKNLAQSQKIEKINLSGNLISDKGVELIATLVNDLPDLKILDLSDNRISEKGLQYFSEILKREHFKLLNVTGNNGAYIMGVLSLVANAASGEEEQNKILKKLIWLPHHMVKDSYTLGPLWKEVHNNYYLGLLEEVK